MYTKAKDWQFARLAGLGLAEVNPEGVEWLGRQEQFKELREWQARDDRGEFYQRYPWEPIQF